MKYWEKFYECECSAEVIALQHEGDEEWGDPGILHMAFFQQSFYGLNSLTWKERFRAIWVILTKGTLWTDNVIFDYKTAYTLGTDLIAFAKESEKAFKKSLKKRSEKTRKELVKGPWPWRDKKDDKDTSKEKV